MPQSVFGNTRDEQNSHKLQAHRVYTLVEEMGESRYTQKIRDCDLCREQHEVLQPS